MYGLRPCTQEQQSAQVMCPPPALGPVPSLDWAALTAHPWYLQVGGSAVLLTVCVVQGLVINSAVKELARALTGAQLLPNLTGMLA